MERTRELYMDVTIAGRNFERKDEILTLKSENTIEILDAYFAESKIEKVYEGKEEIYIVKEGDSLGSIANKKGTTVDAIIVSDPNITAQNKGDIKVGQKIKIASQKEKGENITFKRINKASIGKEVYIIVNTRDFQSGSLKINIRQGKQEGIAAQDNVIPVTIEDKRKQTFEATVGSMSSSDYLNKNDYCDMAIVSITLDPANKEDLKSWNDKLENLEGKKTKLYLLIDAHSGNTDKEVIYHGQNPGKDGKPDISTKKNYWLDMEGKWFELKKGCDCGKKYDSQFQCTKYGSVYGPVYWGSKKLENYNKWDNLISLKKATNDEKDIIIGMSPNEGNLDAVQSYDSEILTAGAMQKTINPEGKGEFPLQVLSFKNDYPEKYKSLFEECGWTVEDKTMYYKDPEVLNAKKVTGKELKRIIREGFIATEFNNKLKCKPLEPIVNAVNDEDFQAQQIEDFIYRLKKQVLPIIPSGYSYSIENYLKSKLGRATVLDHHINRPAYVASDLGESLDNFFLKKDNDVSKYNIENPKKDKKHKISRNPTNWGLNHLSYETEILEDYGKNRRGTDMESRYTKLKARL